MLPVCSNVRALCVALALLAFGIFAPSAGAEPTQSPSASVAASSSGFAPTNPIVDLALIYDGGEKRLPWTPERLRPYVCRDKGDDVEWLFDGFLFIEYLAKSGKRLCPITSRPNATKEDWLALMDHYFLSAGESITALEAVLAAEGAKGRVPARKRKVVITLPTPIGESTPLDPPAATDWGSINGRAMDFRQRADRIAAATWYVDEVLKRWRQKQFKHLEFAGFYWVFERAWTQHASLEIGNYIRGRGSRLYWIPSWPQGRKNWPQYGFDLVYQQPNYFFHRQPTPADRLEQACAFAESCGTTMEMEFNKDLVSKPEFLKYFDEYIEAYRRWGVWEGKPVAYYEGAGAWGDMSKSTNPEIQKRYRVMADLIVQRQVKADKGSLFSQSRKPSANRYLPAKGGTTHAP